MKKITMMAALLLSANIFAQTPPQGNPPANNTNSQARAAWYRRGNTPINTNPTGANIFGTMWNSPIYTYTAGQSRMKLNGSLSYNINGFNAARDGYLWLGPNAPIAGGGTYYNNKGAFIAP